MSAVPGDGTTTASAREYADDGGHRIAGFALRLCRTGGLAYAGFAAALPDGRSWARPGSLGQPAGSEQQGGQRGTSPRHAGIPGREDVEQADQVHAGLVPVLA